jgi:hypothetical protein
VRGIASLPPQLGEERVAIVSDHVEQHVASRGVGDEGQVRIESRSVRPKG